MSSFAAMIVSWQATHGRHGLPWQRTRDPYHVWLSEIMLQQTQVGTVIPYYERFITAFPDVATLARADVGEVLRLWSGLGYYARARNLHRTAQIVMDECAGRFPDTAEALAKLPGIGRSTAAAIAVFAFGAKAAILDGNVKRILARAHAVAGWPGDRRVENELWRLAESLLPVSGIEPYTQGLMDLGTLICVRSEPRCEVCPIASMCRARALDAVGRYPGPRPRTARPRRRRAFLVIIHDARVLLVRRPPVGIWGGLLSLPEHETDDVDGIEAVCRERHGVCVQRVIPLRPVEHGFTHFSLEILPFVIHASVVEAGAAEVAGVWLPLDEATKSEVPAPVRRLLESLATTAPSAPS
ncbi:MAG: A/G-specific adenine glycosylase [Betaproteobacteria bacterium]|nr:A/G-specific adenine glycosylase [Betaproteobacteria bacterium]